VLKICEIARCDPPKLQQISGNWVENVLFQFCFRAAKLLEPIANAPGAGNDEVFGMSIQR